MKIKHCSLLLCLTAGLAGSSFGQIATFDFSLGSLADSANAASLTVSDASTDSSFNSFTSSTGWDSAAQVSGAGSFFSAPATQAAAGNAIVFTITAEPGSEFSISDFSFEARSTGNAPADIGFIINGTAYDFSAGYSNDSTITTVSQTALGFTGLTSATVSIQGWNAAGSSALQLDNIQVTGSVVPEPGTFGLMAGCLALAAVLLKRRRA